MKTELECGETKQAEFPLPRPVRIDWELGETRRPINHPLRLLMVEDASDFAQLLGECLGSQGLDVALAPDGATAMRLLEHNTFEVVLMDVELPDFSGFEVAARASAAGHLRGARIIFCTGSQAEERLPLALKFWGSSFLEKPFKVDRLLKTIAEVMAASPPQSRATHRQPSTHDVANFDQQP